MRSSVEQAGRDPSLDKWGKSYRLMRLNENTLVVVSDGADMKPDTGQEFYALTVGFGSRAKFAGDSV